MKTVKLSRTLTAVLALLLALCLSLPLTACGGGSPTETATGTGSETVTEAARDTDTATGQTVDKNLNVNVAVLSGTTGFGMAQLMEQSSKGASALKYTFRVESDASNILPALLNGSVDIAALPTNAAANLYAKKAGAVQVLAVNTLGVLYVVTGEGVSVSSFEDLKGKTVYCPAQNPTFIFTAEERTGAGQGHHNRQHLCTACRIAHRACRRESGHRRPAGADGDDCQIRQRQADSRT